MSNFLENYGKAIFVLVLVAILIAFASPIGVKIKTAVLAQVDKIASIGNDEIENRNPKNYETVDIEKSWTETHTGTYFFERVSSDKTNADYNKWKSNNKGKNSTSAVSTFTIDAPKDMEYSFDWTVSSEYYSDKLTITYNGTTIVDGVSGIDNGTQKITLKSGTNTLTTTYSKDGSVASGDDCATITLSDIKVSVCKNKQTGKISNHNYDKGKITKEATCTKNGEKLITCKNCGKTKTEIINKLGHNYDKGKITKEATCSTNGEKLFTCKKCGNTKTEVINKLVHNFVSGICTNCGLKISDMSAVDQVYCIYYNDGEMTISQNEIEPEDGRTVINKGFFEKPMNCTQQMTMVRFVGAVKPNSCAYWFGDYNYGGCSNLTEIKNIDNLYTNECTDMSHMFNNCSSLTSLDLSGWNIGYVTDMSCMFQNCSSLTSLDLSGWNSGTETETNMGYMFNNCSSLTSLDLSGWNIGYVTDMSCMFSDCSSLISLDLSGWNIKYMTDLMGWANSISMASMFYGCSSLTSLDLSGWNTEYVNNMNDMFNNCSSLINLDVNGWNTKNVTDMEEMFCNCSRLTSLNVSEWNTANVTSMSHMFSGCSSLISLDLSGWNTENVTSMSYMFQNCSSLTNLDLNGWDNGNVKSMDYTFFNCSRLTSLNVSEWNTANVTNMSNMFSDCSSLISLDLSGWNTEKVTNMAYMFHKCNSLTSLDLSGWNIENVTSHMYEMFYECNNLKSITAPKTVQEKILLYKYTNYVPSGVTWIID